MQYVTLDPPPPKSEASTQLVMGPHVVVSIARTKGVPMFERCPPVHSILFGHCSIELDWGTNSGHAQPVKANTPHRVVRFEGRYAGVAYLDARRYAFDDVETLAYNWQSFKPGRDDIRKLFADALQPRPRRVDPRLIQALQAMECEGASVATAAKLVALSASRLTHLMTEILGAPPRTWAAWFKLRDAMGHILQTGASLTEAAHYAGFTDSAHLTRMCKLFLGVRPAMMLPRGIYVSTESFRAKA